MYRDVKYINSMQNVEKYSYPEMLYLLITMAREPKLS